MTEWTLPTTEECADAMHVGIRTFDFRYQRETPTMRVGDVIAYTPFKERRRLMHPILNDRFKVVYIDRKSPQLQKGVFLICIKRIAR